MYGWAAGLVAIAIAQPGRGRQALVLAQVLVVVVVVVVVLEQVLPQVLAQVLAQVRHALVYRVWKHLHHKLLNH
jgi:hypothetical protein